jgi:hypothetical protein
MGNNMGTLADCLSKIPRLEREYKVGLKSRAAELRGEGMDNHAAEVAAVTEARDNAVADIEKVQTAMSPPKGPVPPSFAGRRAEAVRKAADRAAGAGPEAKIALMQKVRDRVTKMIEKHDAGFPPGEPKRIALIQAIAEYNAMLKILPSDIRGKVGEFGVLARMSRKEEALADFYTKAIERMDKVLEAELRAEYHEKIGGILESAKPAPGKKPMGKIGVAGHQIVAKIETIRKLDQATLLSEKQRLLAEIAAAEAGDTDKIADLTEELQLHEMFGDLDNKSAASLSKSYAFLKDVYTTGRNQWKTVEAARIANIKAMRGAAIADTGKAGSDPELIQAKENDKKMLKTADNALASLLSFEQVVQIALGKDSAVGKQFVARERAAKSQKRAARLKFEKEFHNLLASMYPGIKSAIGRERKRAELQDRDKGITVKKAEGDVKLTQMEAVHMSMLWKQDRYKETMRKHGWLDTTMQDLEGKLLPEAKVIRQFFATKYNQGHASINDVFKRMYGIDLPQEANYAPGTFEHEGPQVSLDPYGHGLIPEGGVASGFLKGRREHSAIPRIEDAYNVFLGHTMQTEHWKAYAELTRDMNGVLRNTDVSRAIRAKEGDDYYRLLAGGDKSWLKALEKNGIDARGGSQKIDAIMRRYQSAYAKIALAWNIATMLKQSAAALGAMFDMPAIDYTKGFAKLLTGQLETRKIYNHPMIQQRMQSGYSPEARIAIDSMFNAAPSISAEMVEKGMAMIGNVDAFFTTASAAIAYDYAYKQAIKAGMDPAKAEETALRSAEATVARTAQPAEMSDRSMFELGLSPTGRGLFMFMSDMRQKLALEYMAFRDVVKSGGKEGKANFARVAFLNHFLIPGMMFAISAMWRDIRDDDDDEVFDLENWSPTDFLIMMAAGPIEAIPGLGGAFGASFEHSVMKDIWSVGNSLAKDGWPDDQEKMAQLVKKTANAAGTLASMFGRPEGDLLGVSAKTLQQIYQIVDNFSGQPKD